MDLSTLSRQLNMSVQDLRFKMKEAGFRVSLKARKVDNSLAKEIVKKLTGAPAAAEPQEIKITHVEVPAVISVKDFAQKLGQSVTAVIKVLIQNGIMATINEEIDAETAAIIGQEFGVEVATQKPEGEARLGLGYAYELVAQEDPTKLQPRPPIVAVMGHVDHGKTTLLDMIRKTNVAGGEAGAITQHIGAYQIVHQGQLITFLDTPGHEAFAAMRARGANVTDIIVLVVAADDSVKPQTVEVINRAKLTKTPIVVAINKIDKPGANPDKVKGDLANLGVTVEDWGGTVPAIALSAKTGEGIEKLLEIILLTAEVEELKANPAGQTVGAVIESHLSRGQGAEATVLVQNGTLQIGDPVVVGRTHGKIRSLQDALGKKLKAASPATPVQISGLSGVPEVGDILRVTKTAEEAKVLAVTLEKQERARKLQAKKFLKTDPSQQELKLIIRTDVQGSLGAITDALSKLESEDVKLKIVDQGVGEITESDIQLAENTKSVILGFHTRLKSSAAAKLAKQKNVTVDLYEIIYELLEDVTSALLQMMPVQVLQVTLGRTKIKAIFRTERDGMIVGGEVIEGKIVDKKKFNIVREKQMVGEGKIEELQQNKLEVDEVSAGKEFGVKVKTRVPVLVGDIFEVFDETVKKKELSQ